VDNIPGFVSNYRKQVFDSGGAWRCYRVTVLALGVCHFRANLYFVPVGIDPVASSCQKRKLTLIAMEGPLESHDTELKYLCDRVIAKFLAIGMRRGIWHHNPKN